MRDHLDLVIKKLKKWVRMNIRSQSNKTQFNVLILPSYNLKGLKFKLNLIQAFQHLQSPFGILATQANGTSIIFDTMFDGRLKYIDELIKMGANAT